MPIDFVNDGGQLMHKAFRIWRFVCLSQSGPASSNHHLKTQIIQCVAHRVYFAELRATVESFHSTLPELA